MKFLKSRFFQIILIILCFIFMTHSPCSRAENQEIYNQLWDALLDGSYSFSQAQQELERCLEDSRNSAQQFLSSYEGKLYQVVNYLEAEHNCVDNKWNDGRTIICLKIAPGFPGIYESEDNFEIYQNSFSRFELSAIHDPHGDLTAPESFFRDISNGLLISKAIFYKDASYCSSIVNDEISSSICNNIFCSESMEKCARSIDGSIEDGVWIDYYYFLKAAQTKNSDLCRTIGNDFMRLSCEMFYLMPQERENHLRALVAQNACYSDNYAILLAVLAVRDSERDHPETYCEKIPLKTKDYNYSYRKCLEFVDRMREQKAAAGNLE